MEHTANPATQGSKNSGRQPAGSDNGGNKTLWLTGKPPSGLQADPAFIGSTTETAQALRLFRAAWSREHIRSLASSWSSWEAFADHHDLDPLAPTDADLVAFVQARALVGASWNTIQATLTAVRTRLEGTPRLAEAGPLTIAATRHLNDLFGAGTFDPVWQAPALTVGQVVGMVQAASPRDAFLVGTTYLAGMRPGEWSRINRDHIQADSRGLLMFLPNTKTGRWQKVAVKPLPGTPLDVVTLAEEWLAERGEEPGALLTDGQGSRLGEEHTSAALIAAAAAAGIQSFSPYSLRRSMAVHADLLGVPGEVVRQRLRHTPNSQTYRRYIEPLLALMDREGAAAHYLNTTPPSSGPVPVGSVRGGNEPVSKFSFAAGSLDDLLTSLDLPSLRVPRGLVDTARSSIEAGQAVFRRWVVWAQGRRFDPIDPPTSALTGWVLHRQGEVLAVSVESELSRLRIGWLDATGRDDFPGWEMASLVAHTAAEVERAEAAPRYLSRVASAEDRAGVCAAVAVGEPPVEWAVVCLAWSTGASQTVEVLEVGPDDALVAADGVEMCVRTASAGLFDPVRAAERLGTVGPVALNGSHSVEDVWLAGERHSRALRDRLAVVLLAGSGTRPSDIARARVKRVEVVPGGLAVFLGAAKGRKPSRLGRDRLIWAPDRPGVEDPRAAWSDWQSWHPAAVDGPLLPRSVLSADPRGKGLSASAVSDVVSAAIAAAGVEDDLTAYGFRYGRAQEMHDAGMSDETVAEALGHDDLRTTRGYIQQFDPFADGLDAGFAQGKGNDDE